MNFLQLCQDLARDSGTLAGGATVSTVLNATGRIDKMRSWVAKAWLNIQNDRPAWPWMQREFVSALVPAQARYAAVDLGIAERFDSWVKDGPRWNTVTLYDPAIGKEDEGSIIYLDYDCWRGLYARGVHDGNRPTEWSIDYDGNMCFGNTPDKAYVIAGEYHRTPQVLVADTDVPELPAKYHGAIIWEALKIMGVLDGDQQGASAAIGQYMQDRNNLYRDYLPDITIGYTSLDAR